jgi:putative DNA primase/helicase
MGQAPEPSRPQTTEWYRLLIDEVQDYAIFLVDHEGRGVGWNAGAERLLGWTEEEILGQSSFVVFVPEDIAKGDHLRELEKAAAEGRAENERWHRRKDGSRFWGSGNNGKSTRLSIMREVLGEGEYALRTDIKAFTEADAKYHPASAEYYLAKLYNVRLAYASENEEGAKLSESLIKDVTGGVDFINARLPYGHPFTFQPRFKLWLGTNHEPVIRGTDPAIWRRLRKIPFVVSFDGREDKDLFSKLCQELPGILNRMIRGCLRWQINGLIPPRAVKDATAAYRRGMDVVGRFIDECCLVQQMAKIESTRLYEAYKQWCEENGEEWLSQKKLAERLQERGFRNDTKNSTTKRVQWTGIGLFS